MRTDIQKVICERQRVGSREKSVKTSRSFNPKQFYIDPDSCDSWESPGVISGVDYESIDCGPARVSSARRRQGSFHKQLNENLNPLTQFLDKSVGRPWDDVYSEIRTQVDHRRAIGFHVLQHVGWEVAQDIQIFDDVPYQFKYGRRSWQDHEYIGLYVHPDTGILCKSTKEPYVRPTAPVTAIKVSDHTWFKLEILKDRNLECNCRHFKVPPQPEGKGRVYYSRNSEPAVCYHGNEPTPRPIWYVETYAWHSPYDVYKVVHYGEFGGGRYGLQEGESRTVYYRDVPDLLAKATVTRKKVANGKELRLIKAYIEGGGVNQPSPDVRDPWKDRYDF